MIHVVKLITFLVIIVLGAVVSTWLQHKFPARQDLVNYVIGFIVGTIVGSYFFSPWRVI